MNKELTVVNNQQISISEIQELGKHFVESGFFQDSKSVAQAIVKIQAGQEMGIPPFAAMSGIHIIHGRPTVGAGLMAARIKASSKYNYRVIQHDDNVCIIDFYEIFYEKTEKIGRSQFTITDGRKAGTQNLNKFPRNMLFARAISNGVKWFCPDVFSSPVFLHDEVSESFDEDSIEGQYTIIDESEEAIKTDNAIQAFLEKMSTVKTEADLTDVKLIFEDEIGHTDEFKTRVSDMEKLLSQKKKKKQTVATAAPPEPTPSPTRLIRENSNKPTEEPGTETETLEQKEKQACLDVANCNTRDELRAVVKKYNGLTKTSSKYKEAIEVKIAVFLNADLKDFQIKAAGCKTKDELHNLSQDDKYKALRENPDYHQKMNDTMEGFQVSLNRARGMIESELNKIEDFDELQSFFKQNEKQITFDSGLFAIFNKKTESLHALKDFNNAKNPGELVVLKGKHASILKKDAALATTVQNIKNKLEIQERANRQPVSVGAVQQPIDEMEDDIPPF